MGNQASTPLPSSDAGSVGPSETGTTDPADGRGRITTMTSKPINFVSEKIFSQQPKPAIEMKRPLPPPKSRAVVREGKRARDIIDLCGDVEDASPNAKKAKIKKGLDGSQPSGTPAGDVLGMSRTIAFLLRTDMSAVVGEKLPGKLGLCAGSGRTGGGGAGVSDVWSAEGGRENAMVTSTTPERKKKKLFTTLARNGVARGADNKAAALNGDVASGAVLQFHASNTDGLHSQSASPLSKCTAQLLNESTAIRRRHPATSPTACSLTRGLGRFLYMVSPTGTTGCWRTKTS
jgi:hypothetical protein